MSVLETPVPIWTLKLINSFRAERCPSAVLCYFYREEYQTMSIAKPPRVICLGGIQTHDLLVRLWGVRAASVLQPGFGSSGSRLLLNRRSSFALRTQPTWVRISLSLWKMWMIEIEPKNPSWEPAFLNCSMSARNEKISPQNVSLNGKNDCWDEDGMLVEKADNNLAAISCCIVF